MPPTFPSGVKLLAVGDSLALVVELTKGSWGLRASLIGPELAKPLLLVIPRSTKGGGEIILAAVFAETFGELRGMKTEKGVILVSGETRSETALPGVAA